MKRRTFLLDLRLQVLVLYLLLVAPLLGTLFALNQVARLRIRQSVEESRLSLTQAIAQATEATLQDALQAVAQLAEYPAVRQADVAGMRPLFEVMLRTHPQVNLVYRLDARGIMRYHYPEGPGSTIGVDFSFRDYFQRALTTRAPLLSQGRISPTTQQPVTTAVMPLWSAQGEFLGLIGANLRLESLSQVLKAIREAHSAEADLELLVLDNADQIIAHPEAQWLLKPADSLLPLALIRDKTSQAAVFVTRSPSGEERLYVRSSLPSIGWTVILSQPLAVAFAPQAVFDRLTALAMLTFLLVGLFFWWALARRVIRPIERLAPISQMIGDNRPIALEARREMEQLARRPDQIGHLIQSILRMEKSIAERFREQATLLETSAAVLSSLEIEVVLDRILEQMARLLNVERCAIIVLDESRGLFRVRASRGLSKHYVEQLTIQPSEPDSVAMRALRSGEPIFVSDTESDPSYVRRRAAARAEGHRALLAVPLKTQHAPPSVLVVYHAQPHEFSYNEIRLLTTFANHAAMAIENALLFERSDMQLEKQTRRLEALMESLEEGILLGDLDERVVYANRRIAEWLNESPEGLRGLPLSEVLLRLAAASPQAETSRALVQEICAAARRSAEIPVEFADRRLFLRLETFEVTSQIPLSLDHRSLAPTHHLPTHIGRGVLVRDVTADRELDRMKSSLISTVSHELRTPLAAIKGYASSLLADDVEWDLTAQREFLTIISQEADRLSLLVDNLLDLSRLEAGSLNLSFQPCDAAQLVRNALARLPLPAELRLELDLPEGLPPVLGDPLRLETVLRNLVENAVKYAGPRATVQISVRQEGDEVVFRVADDGPGIPPQERERIFESFYRVENGLTRTASGAGLGLAICQGLVRAHGGRIWVESPSRGACIAFALPLRKVTAAESASLAEIR